MKNRITKKDNRDSNRNKQKNLSLWKWDDGNDDNDWAETFSQLLVVVLIGCLTIIYRRLRVYPAGAGAFIIKVKIWDNLKEKFFFKSRELKIKTEYTRE